ncbi:hypothetical protein BLNAU_10614 [Blattamonas nauphoetae]|uniref:Uncharacterized protein n=1 Tax=Blattamonas nauphoetae TaxID=2049346 RepID=A0ABQ9XT04_9EUKA|nr:hypothetical protein BLNAU_10614 [Blattamonas nauphoetae]
MTAFDTKPCTATGSPCPGLSSHCFLHSGDCSPFLNWRYNPHESELERAIVFRSLVATVKIQPALDEALEAKAVEFLESVDPYDDTSADAFLHSFALLADESLNAFMQSIVALISSANQAITKAAMKLLKTLIDACSAEVRLALVKADLIPQLIITLNPQSLSLVKTVNIHICLMFMRRS